MNERIVASLVLAANKRLTVPIEPYWCLKFVRIVLEHALFGGRWELYDRYLVAGTSRREGTPAERLKAAKVDPWASDFEASAKKLGWGVPSLLRKPGDLVFNHNALPPQGHVGILLTRDLVVENIAPQLRPNSIHLGSSVSITPYASLPWTLVARVKP